MPGSITHCLDFKFSVETKLFFARGFSFTLTGRNKQVESWIFFFLKFCLSAISVRHPESMSPGVTAADPRRIGRKHRGYTPHYRRTAEKRLRVRLATQRDDSFSFQLHLPGTSSGGFWPQTVVARPTETRRKQRLVSVGVRAGYDVI